MPKATDLSPEHRFMGLFVGPSGSGKTCAECSFPGPVKVLDFDGRIRGILGAPWLDRSKISYEFYPPRQQGMIQRLNSDLEVMQNLANVGQLDTQTLIMDSLTSETFAMLCQSIPLTHSLPKTGGGKGSGKHLGVTPMPGPEDYGFEAQNTYSILSFLRSVPIPNIIVSAHIIDRYGKADSENPYADSVVVGEKLSVRDKIGENVGIYFDHVFRFDKKEVNDKVSHYVKFRSAMARTAYEKLPDGEVDITGKNFYEMMMGYVKTGSLDSE